MFYTWGKALIINALPLFYCIFFRKNSLLVHTERVCDIKHHNPISPPKTENTMGFWSKLKKAVKKVWKAVKSIVRQVVRVIVEVISRIIGIFDLLLGFLTWPPKKLRLHVFILTDENNKPLMSEGDLTSSIDFLRTTLKDRFNITLKPYSKTFVETIQEPAPAAALDVSCSGAWLDEIGEAGDYYAKHLAGWNIIPITVTFPITVFVVRDIEDKIGCSLGPLTDYLTITPAGVKSINTLAHEVGHSCGLWHSGTKSNLMFPDSTRSNTVKWFQKNLLRGSRHVQYW